MEAIVARAAEIPWLKFFGRKAKLYDLLAASPLIVWYVGCVYFQSLSLIHDFDTEHALNDEVFNLVNLSSRLLSLAFGIVLICLLIVRRTPIRKNEGLTPRVFAFLGCYVGIGALVMPTNLPHSPWLLLSMLLIAGGTGFAFYSLFWLGRSISIMPESRKLVTEGPYSLVRHPLYFGEQTALVGIALQATHIWVLAVLVLQFCCQLYRMSYEEKVLTESFPEYEQYQRDTARIIPWLY
jgi:protein-S-isoprenylcysteine O-methyltransferase Ste14